MRPKAASTSELLVERRRDTPPSGLEGAASLRRHSDQLHAHAFGEQFGDVAGLETLADVQFAGAVAAHGKAERAGRGNGLGTRVVELLHAGAVHLELLEGRSGCEVFRHISR